MNWTLRLATAQDPPPPCPPQPPDRPAKPQGKRALFSPAELTMEEVAVYRRDDLAPGSVMPGPAVIAEDETATVVPRGFVARIDPLGAIVLDKGTPSP
jgi:N-methylhydantoinase A